jgi:hypothetical protein
MLYVHQKAQAILAPDTEARADIMGGREATYLGPDPMRWLSLCLGKSLGYVSQSLRPQKKAAFTAESAFEAEDRYAALGLTFFARLPGGEVGQRPPRTPCAATRKSLPT